MNNRDRATVIDYFKNLESLKTNEDQRVQRNDGYLTSLKDSLKKFKKENSP